MVPPGSFEDPQLIMGGPCLPQQIQDSLQLEYRAIKDLSPGLQSSFLIYPACRKASTGSILKLRAGYPKLHLS